MRSGRSLSAGGGLSAAQVMLRLTPTGGSAATRAGAQQTAEAVPLTSRSSGGRGSGKQGRGVASHNNAAKNFPRAAGVGMPGQATAGMSTGGRWEQDDAVGLWGG